MVAGSGGYTGSENPIGKGLFDEERLGGRVEGGVAEVGQFQRDAAAGTRAESRWASAGVDLPPGRGRGGGGRADR